MKKEILNLNRVSIESGGIKYLNQISLRIYEGEIFGMLFINNHGQEQLIDLLRYNIPINYGTVKFNNHVVNHYQNSNQERNNHVAILGDKSSLFKGFSVVDNIFVFNTLKYKYIVNEREMQAMFFPLAKAAKLNLNGTELIESLTNYEQFVVELLKVVYSGAKLIILKNISDNLGHEDIVRLQGLMNYFKSRNISFCYICNHHEEIFKVADRTALFEYGMLSKLLHQDEYSDEIMRKYSMAFTDANKKIQKSNREKSDVIIFENVTTEYLKNFTLYIKEGESIVILDRQNTILNEITHIITRDYHGQGKVTKTFRDFQTMVIPEHPVDDFLFLDFSAIDNLSIGFSRKAPKMWFRKKTIKSLKNEYRNVLGNVLNMNNLHNATMSELYRLIYYKAIAYNPKVLIVFQPFANADMYLRLDIIGYLNNIRERGITVIIMAVSISDTRFISDRMIVVNDGCVSDEISSDSYQEKLMDLF